MLTIRMIRAIRPSLLPLLVLVSEGYLLHPSLVSLSHRFSSLNDSPLTLARGDLDFALSNK
jgi:hypothetical protein